MKKTPDVFSVPRLPEQFYSDRNASDGAICVARRAGIHVAAIADRNSATNAAATIGRSKPPPPNTKPPMARTTSADNPRPRTSPAAVSDNPSRITSETTSLDVAPSASRMPNSRVRRATRYALTP